jgi:hypothetical protein
VQHSPLLHNKSASTRRVVAPNAEVQIDTAALPLDIIDLALAVFLGEGAGCGRLSPAIRMTRTSPYTT